MKAQVPISVRYLLPSWVIGTAITAVLLTMLAAGVMSPLLLVILRPGLLLAERMGYGMHEMRAYILMVFVDSIFYGAMVFVIMLMVMKR